MTYRPSRMAPLPWPFSVATGVVAAAMTIGLLALARALWQVRTLPERVVEASLILVGPARMEAAIQRFGPGAKEYAFYAATLGMFVVLTVIGALAVRRVTRATGFLLLGPACWLVAMGVVLPFTGGGFFGLSLFQHPTLVNAVYLGSGMAFASTLLLGRVISGSVLMGGTPMGSVRLSRGRRSVLLGAIMSMVSFLTAAVFGKASRGVVSSLPLATLPTGFDVTTPSPTAPAASTSVPIAGAASPPTEETPALATHTPPVGSPLHITPTAEPPVAAAPAPIVPQSPPTPLPPTQTPPVIMQPTPPPVLPTQQLPTATASSVPRPPTLTVPPTVIVGQYPEPPRPRQIPRGQDGAALAVSRPKGQQQTIVTPNDDFYVVTKNAAGDPLLTSRDWRLIIDGAVQRPVQIDYPALRGLPSVTLYKTLECISNPTARCELSSFGCDLISTAQWTGARLSDVVALAGGVKPGVVAFAALSADEFTSAIPATALWDPDVLLVYAMNGTILPREHGFPARLLMPDRYGMKSAKWVIDIRAMTQQYIDWYGQRNWSQQGIVKTMTRIDEPARGAKVTVGIHRIAGIAYAGRRGISRVEVSADGGASWFPATLEPSLGADTFVRWSGAFFIAAGQRMDLMARSTDGLGELQSQAFVRPQPDGGSGWDSIRVEAI